MFDRAFGVVGAALTLLSYGAPQMFPKLDKRFGKISFIVGIFLMSVALVLFFLPENGRVEEAKPSISGDCNAIGDNNSTCNR